MSRNEFERDLKQSTIDALSVVFPTIRDFLGGGCFRPIESPNNQSVFAYVDREFGVDFIQQKGNEIKTIGSRVQYGNFGTWTIRTKREYYRRGILSENVERKKREQAIKMANGFYPDLTIQSYINKDSRTLNSSGVINTKDLFDLEPNDKRKTVDSSGTQYFDIVQFESALKGKKCFEIIEDCKILLPHDLELGFIHPTPELLSRREVEFYLVVRIIQHEKNKTSFELFEIGKRWKSLDQHITLTEINRLMSDLSEKGFYQKYPGGICIKEESKQRQRRFFE